MNHHIGSRVRLFEQKENMASSSMSSNESMLSYFHLRRSGRRIDSQETLILGKTDGDTELPDSRPVEFEAVRSSAELAAFFPRTEEPNADIKYIFVVVDVLMFLLVNKVHSITIRAIYFRLGFHWMLRFLKMNMRRKGWKMTETTEMPGPGFIKMLPAEYEQSDYLSHFSFSDGETN